MSKGNKLVRQKYKEQYKEMMKGIPKKQRPTFSQVFRQIRVGEPKVATTTLPNGEVVAPVVEDVDMNELDDLFAEAEEGV